MARCPEIGQENSISIINTMMITGNHHLEAATDRRMVTDRKREPAYKTKTHYCILHAKTASRQIPRRLNLTGKRMQLGPIACSVLG